MAFIAAALSTLKDSKVKKVLADTRFVKGEVRRILSSDNLAFAIENLL